MERTTTTSKDNLRADSHVKCSREVVRDEEMKRGLFSASSRPKRLCDVENFKTLHRPRVHGMTEWLLQYENARRQQETYLHQLKELRQQFQSQNPNKINICRSDQKTTDIQCFFWRSGIPLSRLNNTVPNDDNVQLQKKQRKFTGDHREFVKVPEFSKPGTDFLVTPMYVHATVYSLRSDKRPDAPLPLEDADRRTDYEPIEMISRRNKLHLSNYFRVNSEKELPSK